MDENDIEAIYSLQALRKLLTRLKHSFIISTPVAFGFGPNFIQWVKTFFENAESYVMNNGTGCPKKCKQL